MNQQVSSVKKEFKPFSAGGIISVILIFCLAASCLIGGLALRRFNQKRVLDNIREFDANGDAGAAGSLKITFAALLLALLGLWVIAFLFIKRIH